MPALWALWGRQAVGREHLATFYAEKICVEDRVTSEPDGPRSVSVREQTDLYVLYRNPETGEAVERRYSASVIQSPTDAVAVDAPHDGEYIEVAYPGLRLGEGSKFVALPKSVYKGEPWNFRASIDVAPTEQRVDQ